MDYKEKYNKLVEAVKVLQEENPSDEGIQNFVNDNVPELKESVNERVRKRLIAMCQHYIECYALDQLNLDGYKEALAWLEKQGTSYTKRDVDDAYVEGMAFAKEELEKQSEKKCIDDLTQQEAMDIAVAKCFEQGGQNPIDKVVPKFKVGDSIRRKTPSSCDKDMQVARIEKDYYICNHIGKFSSEVVPFSKESSYELIGQKPTWSKKDDETVTGIINDI